MEDYISLDLPVKEELYGHFCTLIDNTTEDCIDISSIYFTVRKSLYVNRDLDDVGKWREVDECILNTYNKVIQDIPYLHIVTSLLIKLIEGVVAIEGLIHVQSGYLTPLNTIVQISKDTLTLTVSQG